MIKNFETHTKPLNDHELHIAALIKAAIEGLTTKYGDGQKSVVSNSQLIKWLERSHQIKTSGARVRKIMNHLRVTAQIPQLAANSYGYYVCKDKIAQHEYVKSLNSRIRAILAVRNAFCKQCDIDPKEVSYAD